MREIILCLRVSVSDCPFACVSRKMRLSWHVCIGYHLTITYIFIHSDVPCGFRMLPGEQKAYPIGQGIGFTLT